MTGGGKNRNTVVGRYQRRSVVCLLAVGGFRRSRTQERNALARLGVPSALADTRPIADFCADIRSTSTVSRRVADLQLTGLLFHG